MKSFTYITTWHLEQIIVVEFFEHTSFQLHKLKKKQNDNFLFSECFQFFQSEYISFLYVFVALSVELCFWKKANPRKKVDIDKCIKRKKLLSLKPTRKMGNKVNQKTTVKTRFIKRSVAGDYIAKTFVLCSHQEGLKYNPIFYDMQPIYLKLLFALYVTKNRICFSFFSCKLYT